jgi:hypothetical protein
LLDAWLADQPRAAVRLLGVGLSALSPEAQLDLFAAPPPAGERPGRARPPARQAARIDPTLDRIREKFGSEAVKRASSLERGPKEDGFTGVRRRS